MTRFSGAAATSAAADSTLQYRQLVDVGITSGYIYTTNGNRFFLPGEPFMHSANTYVPVGQLGGIEPVAELSDVQPKTMRLWLQAVGSADLYEPSREDMFNRQVVIRHGYTHVVSGTFVSTPEVVWKGYINSVTTHFADAERGNFFEIEAETSLRRKAEITNFTKEALQTVLSQSGDSFFNFIHQVPVVKALWGQNPTKFEGHYGGGSFQNFILDFFSHKFRHKG